MTFKRFGTKSLSQEKTDALNETLIGIADLALEHTAKRQAEIMNELEKTANNASTYSTDAEFSKALDIFDISADSVNGSANKRLVKTYRDTIESEYNILKTDQSIQQSIFNTKQELNSLGDTMESEDIVDILGSLDEITKAYRGNASIETQKILQDEMTNIRDMAELAEDIAEYDLMPGSAETFTQFKARYPLTSSLTEPELKAQYEEHKIVTGAPGYQLDKNKSMKRAYAHLQRGELDKAQVKFDEAEGEIVEDMWKSYGNIIKERSSDANAALYYKDPGDPDGRREIPVHPDIVTFKPADDQKLDRITMNDLRRKYEHNIRLTMSLMERKSYQGLTGESGNIPAPKNINPAAAMDLIEKRFALEGKRLEEINMTDLQSFFKGFETGLTGTQGPEAAARGLALARLMYGYMHLQIADRDLTDLSALDPIVR